MERAAREVVVGDMEALIRELGWLLARFQGKTVMRVNEVALEKSLGFCEERGLGLEVSAGTGTVLSRKLRLLTTNTSNR
jgi:hypothetical protein